MSECVARLASAPTRQDRVVSPTPTGLGEVQDLMRALSDPIRWEIVHRLARAPEVACSELAEVLPVAKATVSYHVRVLEQAGLIETRKQGRRLFYRLLRESVVPLMLVVGGLEGVAAPVPAPGPATTAGGGLPTW